MQSCTCGLSQTEQKGAISQSHSNDHVEYRIINQGKLSVVSKTLIRQTNNRKSNVPVSARNEISNVVANDRLGFSRLFVFHEIDMAREHVAMQFHVQFDLMYMHERYETLCVRHILYLSCKKTLARRCNGVLLCH